jgi:hypothetical protein
MPIREFSCCAQHVIERLLTRSQDDATKEMVCPQCGQPAAKREFSTCGFLLMPGNGGFYRPHDLQHERATKPVTTGGGKNIPDIPGVTRPE